jgi:hypothetical protein
MAIMAFELMNSVFCFLVSHPKIGGRGTKSTIFTDKRPEIIREFRFLEDFPVSGDWFCCLYRLPVKT